MTSTGVSTTSASDAAGAGGTYDGTRMKPVKIFRHVEWEGPGYLTEVLRRRKVPCEIVAVDREAPVPEGVDEVSALVFMGGPMSANDTLPWIDEEVRLIRRALEAGIPMLGHCLGGQLIAMAMGATVRRNPVKEIGWYPVARIDNEVSPAWLGDLPQEFEAFHWHGETFGLPDGAAPLLKSHWCLHQGFARGNVLALQCHVEVTAEMVREWVTRFRDELERSAGSVRRDDTLSLNWANSVQGPESIQAHLEERVASLHGVADVLYEAWLRTFAPA